MSRRPHRLPLRRPWRLAGFSASGGGKDETTRVNVPREPRRKMEGSISPLRCSTAPSRASIREFTERIYGPAYDDWTTLHMGNTDGCGRIGFLADQRRWVVVSPGGAALPECCSIRETRSPSRTRSGRTSLHLLLRGDQCVFEGGHHGWSRHALRRAHPRVGVWD
jgi:hypothetical protein